MKRRSRFEPPVQPPHPDVEQTRAKAWATRRQLYGPTGHKPQAYGGYVDQKTPTETQVRPRTLDGGTVLGRAALSALVALYLGERLTRDFMLNRLRLSPDELERVCKQYKPRGSNEFL